MRKRPLCFLALVLAAVLLLLDKGGLSGKGKPPDHPVIQDLIEKGEPVEVFGEADRWETYETGQYLYLKHTILPYSGEQIPLHGVKVKIRERKKWKTGELVRVRGVLTLPEKGRNPGQFDSRAYLACRDIYFQVEKGNAESTGGEADPLGFALQLVREYLERGLDRAAPVREAGVLRAMLLGEKKEAGEEIRLLYQISAMSHLVPMFITTLSQTRMKSRFLAADEYISPKKSNSVGASWLKPSRKIAHLRLSSPPYIMEAQRRQAR